MPGIVSVSATPVTGYTTLFAAMSLEAILYGFFQEDVSMGPVSSWPSWGHHFRIARPTADANRPTRDADGVKFSAGAQHHLAWQGDTVATVQNRWGVVTWKTNRTSGQDVNLASINGAGTGAVYRQPYFQHTDSGSDVHFYDSTFRQAVNSAAVGGSVSNFMVWYRRGGLIHNITNGVRGTPVAFQSGAYNGSSPYSWLGSMGVTAPCDVWLDAFIMGQSEISDDVADKLVGIAARRVGRESVLVSLGHPYGSTTPSLNESDFNTRFIHDDVSWQAYRSAYTNGINNAASPNVRHAERAAAMPSVPPAGYTPVLYDDFATDTLVDNKTGGLAAIWYAPLEINPGANNHVMAGNAAFPSAHYVHDASGTGSIKLRMSYVGGQWVSAGFSTLDHNGLGRAWLGPWIQQVRWRFINRAGGMWPAFWAYSQDKYFFRTRSPGELDHQEALGEFPDYVSTSLHVHNPDELGTFTAYGIYNADSFEKISGYQLNTGEGWPTTIDQWDGAYHTFTAWMDETHYILYYDGLQVFKDVIQPQHRRRWSIILDQALASLVTSPALNTSTNYDVEIDYVKVWQPTSLLATVPSAGFSARPTVAGTLTVGSTLTCTPNAVATSSGQLIYRWYRSDGSPIVGAQAATYQLTSAESGKGVRVHVVNAGVKDQPEAWTADTANVA